MRRREFMALIGGVAAAWPLAARAQQGERVRRVGVLTGTRPEDAQNKDRNAVFAQALQQLGWTPGRRKRQCPLLAQSRHHAAEFQCPLLGVKRTLNGRAFNVR